MNRNNTVKNGFMQKKIFKLRNMAAIISCFAITTSCCAQELKPIKLNEPNKNRGTSVMKALNDRHSTREFSPEKLSIQDLSDLLWAAYGINRPDGRRTAATAGNNQDIDVYVIMEEGTYLYDAKLSELKPIAAGDFRELISGTQAWAKNAPATLLMVSDISRFVGWGWDVDIETRKQCGALDAGIVSQNIMLFASACGLVTIPRIYMRNDELKKALKLTETQIPMINNPIGYPKK